MSILPISGDRVSLKSLIPLLPQGLQQRLRDAHYLSKLKSAKISDEIDLGVIELLVNPGDTVMDIGANFGLFTRFLSERVGADGKVFSFEPTETMSRVLNHNVTSMDLKNVETSRYALSDKKGSAQIKVPLHNNHSPNYYEASLCSVEESEAGEIDTIETTTLDAFCDDEAIKDLAFIKIDVEGHEIAVLNGARITLERFRPTILLEVNEPLDEEGHGREVRDLTGYLGYKINVFENGTIRKRESGESLVNYVLTPA
ncbi:MAG: FkbM family methyltransferase [Verrucomicrobiales bacterium]|nr:FkbM family methyltransferase [Verrucomicrobiales bacterium]